MRIKPFAVLMMALALPVAATADVNGAGNVLVNKDLTNLGPPANDLAIVLEGTETISRSFDGYQEGPITGWFGSRTQTVVNGNTVIHWQFFYDETDDRIDTNQTIHVGYAIPDSNRKVVDMYLTDENGNRIFGSVVYDASTNTTYRRNRFTLGFANGQAVAIAVKNVRYAVLSEPLPLDQLSQQNADLAAALRSLSSGFVLAPDEASSIELPESVTAGSAVVAVYEVSAAGTSAIVTTYVQSIAENFKTR